MRLSLLAQSELSAALGALEEVIVRSRRVQRETYRGDHLWKITDVAVAELLAARTHLVALQDLAAQEARRRREQTTTVVAPAQDPSTAETREHRRPA